MKGLSALLSQAWQLWKSDSTAETVIAVVMGALAGVLAFTPQLRSMLQRVI